jgi:hypothetical protein
VPADKGANAGLKVSSLVAAGMVAGADSIDDMALRRHGGMGRLFARIYAPSTLGCSCGKVPRSQPALTAYRSVPADRVRNLTCDRGEALNRVVDGKSELSDVLDPPEIGTYPVQFF